MTSQFSLECPKCLEEDQIDIAAIVWVRATDNGTLPFMSHNGDHHFTEKNPALCCHCRFQGKVGDFQKEARP